MPISDKLKRIGICALVIIVTPLWLILWAKCADAGEVKYEVTIKVVYNAVRPSKAAEIIKDAQERHKEACKVEVDSKKVSGGFDSVDSDGSWGIDLTDCYFDEENYTIVCE
jgi:hypothetical protein